MCVFRVSYPFSPIILWVYLFMYLPFISLVVQLEFCCFRATCTATTCLRILTHLLEKMKKKKKNGTSASEIINKNMRNRWSACISYNILTMSIDAICILCVYYTIFGCCCRLVVTIVRTSSARQQRHTMSPIRICMLRLCVCVFECTDVSTVDACVPNQCTTFNF